MTTMTTAAGEYFTLRRALGHRLEHGPQLLDGFLAFATARGETTLTVDAAVAWAATASSPRQVAVRLSLLRKFGAYLAAFDPNAEIVPERMITTGVTRRAPYLFSDEEIEALMRAAAGLSPPLFVASFTALIGLLAATGLRTGEALRLDRDDVDLDGGLLLIRYTKYGRTRRIPLHPSATAALTDYAGRRDRLCPRPADPAFLLTGAGRRLTTSHTNPPFRRLLAETGITAPAGQRAPRLYDLRHTFAVRTMTGWHAAGADVAGRLPLLSLYLGHVNPAHTYWYLQAVPELISVLADRIDAYIGSQP
jgi:integrase